MNKSLEPFRWMTSRVVPSFSNDPKGTSLNISGSLKNPQQIPNTIANPETIDTSKPPISIWWKASKIYDPSSSYFPPVYLPNASASFFFTFLRKGKWSFTPYHSHILEIIHDVGISQALETYSSICIHVNLFVSFNNINRKFFCPERITRTLFSYHNK